MGSTIYSTYIHAKHWFLYGDLYQLTSGPIIVGGLVTIVLKHKCPRIGRVTGDDGHSRCKRCHKRAHPQYGT